MLPLKDALKKKKKKQVPQETSPHLLLGAQDQLQGVKQDQLPPTSKLTLHPHCHSQSFVVTHNH